MADPHILKFVAEHLNLRLAQVQKVAELLDEGATIPFMARYRQEVTGGLDEEQLRAVRDDLEFKQLLEDRKATILKTIADQDKLTPELEKEIKECTDLKKLEDLYLPYKPKRKTRASMAKEKGLEPLAEMIWNQETTTGDPDEIAKGFIDKEKGVETLEEAFAGAQDICAEWINENAEVRDMLRKQIRDFGGISSKRTKEADEKGVYESYYEFKCKIKYLRPHQILALNRGEREGILSISLDVWEEKVLDKIDYMIIQSEDNIFIAELENAISDAWKRLLLPSLERELRNDLTELADQHAIQNFAENLGNLLMQPPLASKMVMGIDPAYRTGCKVAVIDTNGNYLEGSTVYPTPPHNKVREAVAVMNHYIDTHKIELIAIGNGTGSRETEQIVADMIQTRKEKHPQENLAYLIVNEAGASVYSASKEAREEFPELEAAQRGNISIARRVLDPLSELVKIDPKSIGVGLYQHDVNQVKLSRKLDDVVESCVNNVGVNLNTASAALLNYVSGLSKTVANKIIAKRKEMGGFSNRDQLMDVPGVGAFRYQQAAGFLRLPESPNPLDNTAIHPESYDATKKLCAMLEVDLERLPSEKEKLEMKLKQLDVKSTAEKIGIGEPTLQLIMENLLKPGRDPRENLAKPILRQDVVKMEDLKPGEIMEGTVRNVVDFGAFVDIGVKQDGLLHISNMKEGNQKVENPLEIVSVGDIVKVEILDVDIRRQRIGLKLVN